jgi:hypothetical protein
VTTDTRDASLPSIYSCSQTPRVSDVVDVHGYLESESAFDPLVRVQTHQEAYLDPAHDYYLLTPCT